jgi:hypothetical protein
MCRGLGHLQVGVVPKVGPHLVRVNVEQLLEDIKGGLSLRRVSKRYKISVETARVIGNGTWAGFRKT